MTAPFDFSQSHTFRDYIWLEPRGLHIEPSIYRAIPDLTEAIIQDAVDHATGDGDSVIDYSRLGYWIETHLPEIEEAEEAPKKEEEGETIDAPC